MSADVKWIVETGVGIIATIVGTGPPPIWLFLEQAVVRRADLGS